MLNLNLNFNLNLNLNLSRLPVQLRVPVRVLVLGMGLLSLNGCSSRESQSELDNYIAKVKSQAVEKIEPLPDVEPYQNFSYTAGDLRSPFAPFDFQKNINNSLGGNGLHPDMNRRKEVLEAYPLDALRMIGTLEKQGKRWAIIKDSDGTIHRVSVGNYIGQNYGRIDLVQEDKVIITEIIPDGKGGWIKRKANLTLLAE